MSRNGKRIVLICAIWLVGSVALFARQTNYSVLLGFPLAATFLAALVFSLVCIGTDWRQHRWRSLLPLTACVIALFTSGLLIREVDRLLFRWSLPSYEAIISEIEDGKLPVFPEVDSPIFQPEHKARSAYRVLADRDANGVLTVEFITELGFPAKHSGYLYVSSGIIEPGSRMDTRWPIREKVKDNWFYMSN